MLSIGNKIKELRIKKNLTQQELGDLVELSHSQINLYEKGHSKINVEMLQKISKVLGVSAAYFLDVNSNSPDDYLLSNLQIANQKLQEEVLKAKGELEKEKEKFDALLNKYLGIDKKE